MNLSFLFPDKLIGFIMPKLKQPASLQNASMDVLVVFLADHCDRLSIANSLAELRQVIAGIKKDVSPHIPWHLSMEFHSRFLKEVENLQELRMDQAPDLHQKAILEVLMDHKIKGLRCEGQIVTYLHPCDAGRFDELRLLDLSFFCTPMHRIRLEDFHLKNLTTLNYIEWCRDADLKVIGRHCPVLKFLNVTDSPKVTDRGLRWLVPCSEIRSVIVACCRRVSQAGITELLSVLTEIEHLSGWSEYGNYGFDCFSNLDLETVYPRIKSFTIVLDRISNDHLKAVVLKFPNLTSFGIIGLLAADLMLLKPLNQLAKLDFSSASGLSWDELRKLLPFIGANITDLKTRCPNRAAACISQSDLDLLFEICPNLELLAIDYKAHSRGQKLIIPPFKKLKELECRIPRGFARRRAVLEFDEMPELEDLLIDRFYMTAGTLKSMMLDSMTFPKLKLLKISEITGSYSIDDIRIIAIDNNLDFEILEI